MREELRRVRWVAGVAAAAAVAVPVLGLVSTRSAADPVVAAAPPSPPPVLLTAAGTTASPVTWRVPTTGNPAVDDVLRSYQRYLGTTVRLAERPDPADPALDRIATGARLTELRRFLVAAGGSGSVTRGPVAASVRVVETGPTAVTVIGCTDYGRQRTEVRSGTPLAAGKIAATVVLRRTDGLWRAASSTRTTWSTC